MFGKKTNVLVIGKNGQLGSYLIDFLQQNSYNKDSKIGKVMGISHNVTDDKKLWEFFSKNIARPYIDFDVVVNCAAMTDTTACEQKRDESYMANALLPKYIAESCRNFGRRFIHISTDYIFSEMSTENADFEPFPINAYGMHKLLGEMFAKEAFRKNRKDLTIIRTGWLYGNSTKDFPHKVVFNALKSICKGSALSLTIDQAGFPTHVAYLSELIRRIIDDKSIWGEIDGRCGRNYTDVQAITRYSFGKCVIELAFPNWRIEDDEMDKSTTLSDEDVARPLLTIHRTRMDELIMPIRHPKHCLFPPMNIGEQKYSDLIFNLTNEPSAYIGLLNFPEIVEWAKKQLNPDELTKLRLGNYI